MYLDTFRPQNLKIIKKRTITSSNNYQYGAVEEVIYNFFSKVIIYEPITNNILTHQYSECLAKINNLLITHLFLILIIV